MEESKRKTPWLKYTGIGCLSFLILLIGLGFAGIMAFEKVKGEVTPVLTQFIQTLEKRDIEAAQKLAVEGSMTNEELAKLSASSYLFAGFQSVTIESGKISKNANANPLLHGTLAEAVGTIHYEGGEVGQIKSVAKKVDGQWRILNISINVPTERYDRLKNEEEPRP